MNTALSTYKYISHAHIDAARKLFEVCERLCGMTRENSVVVRKKLRALVIVPFPSNIHCIVNKILR